MTSRFEDVCVTEHGTWARVCEKHSLDPSVQSIGAIETEYTCAAESLCDIDNCTEAAVYYIDFYDGNQPIKPTEFGSVDDESIKVRRAMNSSSKLVEFDQFENVLNPIVPFPCVTTRKER